MNLRRIAALASVLVFALAACKGGTGAGDNEIVVGEFGSLTGGTATFGQSTHNGVTMAFEEINAAGGVLGKKLKVLVEDDQSKPEEAATAVTKLISQDRVVAVIGEVASSRTLAAAPIAQANKVPLISPASTNPRVTQVGDYIFRVCFIDPFQGAVMAKFAGNSLKLKKVAILYDVRNDYSVGLRNFFSETFKGLGGAIIGEQSYSEGDSDFRAQLTQLKSLGPEAIYVPGYYTEVGTIARQARELGLTVPLMGGDGWDSPKLTEIGGQAIEGSYLSNHYSVDDPSPAIQKFVTAYKTKYGVVPDALAALGYDAAYVLADAMKRAGSTDGAKVRDAIAATARFVGVTGTINIDKDRNAVKPAVILKVAGGKFEYVETIAP
ncbi:MAG TPA: ABC transporter substrate-binding protein [Steroidobacteraceae bacterium]|nr:ABC transporter substrate-binding protein [Steroidobacteraceae bacterium]